MARQGLASAEAFKKVYDLTERILPSDVDRSEPSLHDYAVYLLDSTVRAHGIVTWKQVLHLKTGQPLKDAMREVLAERIEGGSLSAVEDTGMTDAYVDTLARERPLQVAPNVVKLLSPFDNVVIHRERLGALFGFDYRLECYVPAARRVYGYFCLPVLWGDRFVGRIDCKAHRSERRFEVMSLHIEDQAVNRETLMPPLKKAIEHLAAFNGCVYGPNECL